MFSYFKNRNFGCHINYNYSIQRLRPNRKTHKQRIKIYGNCARVAASSRERPPTCAVSLGNRIRRFGAHSVPVAEARVNQSHIDRRWCVVARPLSCYCWIVPPFVLGTLQHTHTQTPTHTRLLICFTQSGGRARTFLSIVYAHE